MRLDTRSTHPVRVGSATHSPVKLVGESSPLTVKPIAPEAPTQTARRVGAGQDAALARALRNNRYLHFTR